jgi:hypothetical protein
LDGGLKHSSALRRLIDGVFQRYCDLIEAGLTKLLRNQARSSKVLTTRFRIEK